METKKSSVKESGKAIARRLRLTRRIPENTFIGKVVQCEPHRNWALVRPLEATTTKPPRGNRNFFIHFDDLEKTIPGRRLYNGQIIAFSIDVNSKCGVRVIGVEVLEDPILTYVTGPKPKSD